MTHTTKLAPAAVIEPRPARKYRLVETRARRGQATTWLAILELPGGNGATIERGSYADALAIINLVVVPGDEYRIQPIHGMAIVVAITGPVVAQAVA